MTVPPDMKLRALLQDTAQSAEPALAAKQRVRQRIAAKLEGGLATPRFRYVPAVLLGVIALLAIAFGAFERNRARGLVAAVPSASGAAAQPEYSLLRLFSAELLIRPGTQVRVVRDDSGGTLLEMQRGALFAHVDPAQHAPFALQVGDVRLEVTGTLFGVRFMPGETPSVSVVRGTLRVVRGAEVELLTAGMSFGGTPLILSHAEFEVLNASKFAARAPTPLPASSTISPPVLPPAAPTVKTSRDTPAADKPESAYLAAKQSEAEGRVAEALERYMAIAQGPSDTAEDAQFALLRIHTSRGALTEAQLAARTYRKRYPEGRYARAVDVYVLDLLTRAGDTGGALREAEQFLAHYPSDVRAWRFRLVRAEARARTGECAGASEDARSIPKSAPRSATLSRCIRKQAGLAN